jgi:hypothetical protein
MDPAHMAMADSTGRFLGIIACLEIGHGGIGRRSSAKDPKAAHEGVGVIEAAVFALRGLLLGFSCEINHGKAIRSCVEVLRVCSFRFCHNLRCVNDDRLLPAFRGSGVNRIQVHTLCCELF